MVAQSREVVLQGGLPSGKVEALERCSLLLEGNSRCEDPSGHEQHEYGQQAGQAQQRRDGWERQHRNR